MNVRSNNRIKWNRRNKVNEILFAMVMFEYRVGHILFISKGLINKKNEKSRCIDDGKE